MCYNVSLVVTNADKEYVNYYEDNPRDVYTISMKTSWQGIVDLEFKVTQRRMEWKENMEKS